jgi:hypothetical protein
MNVYDGAELEKDGARYWLAMDGWTADNAALLLHGIDPRRLASWANVTCGKLEVEFPFQFDAVKALIAMAFETKVLATPAAPSAVVAWAIGKGLQLPALLIPADMVVKGGRWKELGRQADSTQTITPRQDKKVANEWVSHAQNRAYEIIREQKAKDLYPSQENIADQIAREFRANGRVGADGKPLTGATIKRHALKGINSAIGKQLSTTNRQGK